MRRYGRDPRNLVLPQAPHSRAQASSWGPSSTHPVAMGTDASAMHAGLKQNATVTMCDRKAVIKNADMSEEMQQDSVECATQALEKYNIEKDIAAHIKKLYTCSNSRGAVGRSCRWMLPTEPSSERKL
ncbi:hypothetical protein KIL84_009403 [Mauremys mutica]|uniref:Dynein light chain n=1 Tax=Mauremys mutica TaxID=74926 RepID=A0A9D4AXX0_9SAUR|nr:hypothetical protein KIL84_009403 [Mauremys mutica]